MLAVLGPLLLSTSLAKPPRTTPIDWAQPPVACIEEVVPHLPNRPCLDLTQVADPIQDLPPNLTPSELKYWQTANQPLIYCRSTELLRRENLHPGTFSPVAVEVSWLHAVSVERTHDKIEAIYEASRTQKVPVHILTGAIAQESIFADLGIGEDGGNYSCGIGQGSIVEWCHWANHQSSQTRASIDWPQNNVACDSLRTSLIKPFYEIAITRLQGLPEYRLNSTHFSNIPIEAVVGGFPSENPTLQKLHYRLARSFIDHCSDPQLGIAAKANELALIYKNSIPEGLKAQDVYPAGEGFHKKCQEQGYTGAYPLNQAWLLSVGIYNSGPRAVDALAYYNRWTTQDLLQPSTWNQFTPKDMVEAFYWSGKYNTQTDQIDFTLLDGRPTSWIWFKPCVLQRHIARVIQHVTDFNEPDLVDSLEGALGCTKSEFDPKNGTLIRSSVPQPRQISSGQR